MPMTHKRYLFNPATQGRSRITALGQDDHGRAWCRLQATLFHPQGGGQQADRGSIAGIPVLHVAHTDDGEVVHYLASTDGVAAGQEVALVVDAAWRLLNARHHTAGHLIAALVEVAWPGLRAVAGHHWPGQARVDFTAEGTTPTEEIRQVLAAALPRAIDRQLPVWICGDPLVKRAIAIGDYPPVPCGGTHIEHTGLLGNVEITKVRSKGNQLRISYRVEEGPSAGSALGDELRPWHLDPLQPSPQRR